jgi:ubiquinone/menaquinone biosynthesis C-methylase UbiE
VIDQVKRLVNDSALGARFVDAVARRPTRRLGSSYREARQHEPLFALTLGGLGDVAGQRLVELGPGGGVLLERVLAAGAAFVVGVDHSPDMLAMAHQRNRAAVAARRLRLELGDVATLSLSDGDVDAVYNSSMFFFVERPAAVLTEAARVLRPGGRYVSTTLGGPLPEPGAARAWWLRGAMRRAMRTYTDDELAALLTTAGFADVRITRHQTGDDPDVQHQLVVARTPRSSEGTAD